MKAMSCKTVTVQSGDFCSGLDSQLFITDVAARLCRWL